MWSFKVGLWRVFTKLMSFIGVFPTLTTGRTEVEAVIRSLRPKRTAAQLIRLGPEGDGGYLVPDDLDGLEACFSPGVNQISGFELDCAERGMKVFLADRSVDGPAAEHDLFKFEKKFIGATSNDGYMTLDRWVRDADLSEDGELLLQMDIEGSEYEVFLSATEELMKRFRVIVVEFHKMDYLWSRPFFAIASQTFDKVLQTHTCVHLHPNNAGGCDSRQGVKIPRTIEITFLRNDREVQSEIRKEFPNPLDSDNTNYPPVQLPKQWYAD